MNELELQQQRRAERLASALDAAEAGRDPDIDAREDPELASLMQHRHRAAAGLGRSGAGGRLTPRAHARSSSPRCSCASEQLAGGRERSTPPKVVPFYRRWNVLAPVASAAAAAAVTLAHHHIRRFRRSLRRRHRRCDQCDAPVGAAVVGLRAACRRSSTRRRGRRSSHRSMPRPRSGTSPAAAWSRSSSASRLRWRRSRRARRSASRWKGRCCEG